MFHNYKKQRNLTIPQNKQCTPYLRKMAKCEPPILTFGHTGGGCVGGRTTEVQFSSSEPGRAR